MILIIAAAVVVVVVVVVVLIFSLGLVGGGGGGGGGGAGSSDAQAYILDESSTWVQIVHVAATLSAVEIPARYSASRLNSPSVTSYDDPEDWKDEWRDRNWSSELPAPNWLMEYIYLDDLTTVVIQNTGSTVGFALIGNLPFDDLRDVMEDENWEEDSYRGFEVWNDRQVALLEDAGVILIDETYVGDVLKAMDTGRGLIEGESTLKRILDKVGSGLSIYGETDGCSSFGSPSLRSCDGYGYTYTGGNVDVSLVSAAYLFSSEDRAESNLDNIEEALEDTREVDADIVNIDLSGDFVTYDLEIHEE